MQGYATLSSQQGEVLNWLGGNALEPHIRILSRGLVAGRGHTCRFSDVTQQAALESRWRTC